MNIDTVSFIVAGVVALISWGMTFHQEQSPWYRFFLIISLVLTTIGGGLLVEVTYRKYQLEPIPQQLEREWNAILSTEIKSFEIEVLSPDGMYTPTLLDLAKGVRFEVSGVELISSEKNQNLTQIDFADVLSPEKIKYGARLGHTVAGFNVRTENNIETKRSYSEMNCVSSELFGAKLSPGKTFQEDLSNVCSVAVQVPPAKTGLMLGDIITSKVVTLIVKEPEKLSCRGICKLPVIFSVKVVLPGKIPMFPTMVELSPQVLRNYAPTGSPDARTFAFSLSGPQLGDIAKSYFLQTYGYHESKDFSLTKGLVDKVYRKLAITNEIRIVWGTVWALDSNTKDSFLLDSVPPAVRRKAAVIPGPEWCGFGDMVDNSGDPKPPVCWYRFVIWGSDFVSQ